MVTQRNGLGKPSLHTIEQSVEVWGMVMVHTRMHLSLWEGHEGLQEHDHEIGHWLKRPQGAGVTRG